MTEKNIKQKKNNLTTTKKEANEVIGKTSKSKLSEKKISNSKNASTKKSSKTSNSKTVSKKSTKTKKAVSKKPTAKSKLLNNALEYYDLPFTYNKTFVKILAQTPNTLFVYWDISNEDKKKLIKEHGENFFEKTRPVLIVHNKTKNYSFEIEINDFANSWYFNVNDSKCEYEIELGRKSNAFIESIPNNYMQIAFSNKIEAPNDHILFEKEQKTIFFKNVKTNYEYSKNSINLHFINHLAKAYKIYDFYNKIYITDYINTINNPTSNFTNI